jgi:hypothetical protein
MRKQYYVRPLKWKTNELGTYGELSHDSLYHVIKHKNMYTLYAESNWATQTIGEYKSVKAYKDAAQRHFEKKLTETLLKEAGTTPNRKGS